MEENVLIEYIIPFCAELHGESFGKKSSLIDESCPKYQQNTETAI
jgi:hypothetical protein